MDLEDFDARAALVHVRDMERIAMSQSGGIQAGSVVVDRRGSVNDLVLAVTIQIGNANSVGSLALVDTVPPSCAVEFPTQRQLAVAPIVGRKPCFRVIAAGHYDAGAGAVEVRHRRQKAVHTVPIGVAPRPN